MKNRLLRTFLSIPGVLAARWRSLEPALYCFNYHRIGYPRDCPYDREVFSCTPPRFEEHLRLLSARFEVVAVDQLPRYLHEGVRLERPLAVITFDDGYIDNYLHAFPILRKQRIPAIFFLPTAFIGSRRVPFWDRVAWLLRHARSDHIRLDGWEKSLSLAPADLERTIRDVLRWLKALPGGQMVQRIDELRQTCGARGDCQEAAEPLFLNWDQAREMLAAGMAFGSHTHTHGLLSQMKKEAQEYELSHSRTILENELNVPITTVSYPDGGRSTYDADTLQLVKALGYRVGFNYVREVNVLPIANPFEVGRLAVFDDMGGHRFRSLACFPQYFS
jgi:peptidoglycan/xylan/chitin deacetylase (PgdA/CDA1 family)